MSQPSILFLCESEGTAISEFLPLAVWLQNEGLRPILALAQKNTELENRILENKICYIVMSHEVSYFFDQNGERFDIKESLPNTASSLFSKAPIIRSISYVNNKIKQKLRQKSLCIEALKFINAKAIVIYHEANYLLVPEIIYSAKNLGVKIIRLQMTRTPISFLLSTRLKQGDRYVVKGIVKRIYAALLPRHVQKINGKRIVFYNAIHAFILFAVGMLPKRPWHNGDSYADVNLMMSKFHLEQERAEGWDLPNAHIIGQFSLDHLHKAFIEKESRRHHLLEKYLPHPNSDTKVVIVALPQLYEHKILSKEDALKSISLLIKSFENTSETKFLISLHPKMHKGDYLLLLNNGTNCAIIDERLHDVLPVGDVLLCSFESIVSWAILSEVRPVLLDYYDLGFNGDLYKSCITLKDPNTLASDLVHILKSPANKLILQDKEGLLPFDGCAGQRLKQIFSEMIGQNHEQKHINFE